MSEETHTAARREGPQGASHPTPLTYVIVAMTLAIITAIEVAIFYITGLGHAIISWCHPRPGRHRASLGL